MRKIQEKNEAERKGIPTKKGGDERVDSAGAKANLAPEEAESAFEEASADPFASITAELTEDVGDLEASDIAIYLRWLVTNNRLDTIMSMFLLRCKVIY